MDAVTIQIRHRRAMVLGILFAFFATLWLGMCALFLLHEDGGLSWGLAISILIGLFFGAIATLNIGIAIKRPVALRLDTKGISGFYADPATWQEIREIDIFKGPKGHKFLGFALYDPIGFRDRQTPLRRLLSWSNGRGKGFHIIVPEILLREAKIEDLLTQAHAFHIAA